jgi:hypothetical protein
MSRGPAARIPPAPAHDSGLVYLRYWGEAGITVIGPVTGRAYRFAATGSTVAADPRDAPSLAAVPQVAVVRL